MVPSLALRANVPTLWADVPLFPETASTFAERVDALFFFVLAITAFFTLIIAGLVIYFAIRYRRRSESDLPPQMVGSTRVELFWTAGPLLIALVIFYWGTSVFVSLATPPDEAMDIYVVGRQWMWKIQHSGGQREINTLHVPVHQPIKLIMSSEDVIHSFFVPAFRMKHDVIPGRYSMAWFEATRPGTYHLFCAEYCGTMHSGMIGSVVVMERPDFESWLDQGADSSLATRGRALFLKQKCISCHNTTPRARGPLLESLFGRPVTLEGSATIVADEAYLRESILLPRTKIVAGFQPIMPTYQGQLTEQELLELIAFIKSLGPGDTPLRVEDTAPPSDPLKDD